MSYFINYTVGYSVIHLPQLKHHVLFHHRSSVMPVQPSETVSCNFCWTSYWHFCKVSLHTSTMCLLHVRLYVQCDCLRTDDQLAAVFPLCTQPRGEEGKHPLCESVFERVYYCWIGLIDENNLSFIIVQLYSDLLRFLLQHQLGARRGLSPEWVSIAHTDHPETLAGVEEDRTPPLDGLPGHSDVPVFALAHLHHPAVPPWREAAGPQHTHTAGEAFRVIREELLTAELHTGQIFRQLQVGLGRVWIQSNRDWKYHKYSVH